MSKSDTNEDGDKTGILEEEIPKVVVQHRILKISECFIYRIPPMKSADGHRAEDWNLATPLATCALDMSQRDDTLVISLLANRPMKDGPTGATEQTLFARSTVRLDATAVSPPIQYWAEPVVDSSRYFVLRISDEQKKREAHIGIGFRDRDDATNFRMGMQEYERAVQRDRTAQEMQRQQQVDEQRQRNTDGTGITTASTEDDSVTKLSLKEGEKIHVKLKSPSNRKNTASQAAKVVGTGGLLLKKPPPSADTVANGAQKESEEEGHASSSSADMIDDEDEWGDFQ